MCEDNLECVCFCYNCCGWKKVIFFKNTFSVVCVYILSVWLKVWFDFIVVKNMFG
jgi:hypothetical protein